MGRLIKSLPAVPLLAAGWVLAPALALGQGFAASYELTSRAAMAAGAEGAARGALLAWGPVRLAPTLESNAAGYSGVGLSMQAGDNWFARVGVGRNGLASAARAGLDGGEVVALSGGYRWNDGQSLSLQVTRLPDQQRLGLAVSYDWPRYFVRFSYDPRLLNLAPQDTLRFSAGVRF